MRIFHETTPTMLIFAHCLLVSLSTSTHAEELAGKDRVLVEALMAARDNYVKSIESVRFRFQCEATLGSSVRATKHVAGEAFVDGDNLRIEYVWKRRSGDGDYGKPRRGTLIERPEVFVDYHVDSDRAFRSFVVTQRYDREFAVLPYRSWFLYDFEFPYEEIITADGSFDYGVRTVSLDRHDESYTLKLGAPPRGDVQFRFDRSVGGLLTEVVNHGPNGIRYRATLDWDSSSQPPFPRTIKIQKASDGKNLWTKFHLRIEEFELVNVSDFPADHFRESSLGITSSTTITTFRPGMKPTIHEPKSDVGDDLRAMGESIRSEGFTKQRP